MIKGQIAPEVEYTYARRTPSARRWGQPTAFLGDGGLWRLHLCARLQMARELAEQCFTLAQRLQDPVLLQEAHQKLGATLFYLGELASARTHLEQGLLSMIPTRATRSF